jgi:hypothetical protein
MRKIALILSVAIALFVSVGCGSAATEPGVDVTSSTAAGTGGLVTTSTGSAGTSDTTEAATDGGSGSSSLVHKPHDLLSAEEAAAIVGLPVALEESTLFQDETTGIISERYAYDLSGTGIHALVEVHQDSLKTVGSVAEDFAFEKQLSKSEVEAYDLGDEAFVFSNTGQLHMLYDGYYVVVAFDADPYTTDKNAELNIELGTTILENLKAKLN